MDDYISRETAVAFAEHAYHEWNLAMAAADGQRQITRCFKMQELCKAVASVFEDAPAADVEPVRHGKWIKDDYEFNSCSECGYEWDESSYKTSFCPDCGAKMRGDEYE